MQATYICTTVKTKTGPHKPSTGPHAARRPQVGYSYSNKSTFESTLRFVWILRNLAKAH